MKKIPACYFMLLYFCLGYSPINAQQNRDIIGFNMIPNIGSSLGNLEFSYEKFSLISGGNDLIIPVFIVGFNPGTRVNNNYYNSEFDIKTFYAKVGFEINFTDLEFISQRRTFFQLLLGYSDNKQVSDVTISAHYFDALKYKGYQNFNAYLFQMFLMKESILNEHFSLSYGFGIGVANIIDRSDYDEPIACIGGHGFLTKLLNREDFYANVPFKFSFHYQF